MTLLEHVAAETSRCRVLRQLCEAYIFEGLFQVENGLAEPGWSIGEACFKARIQFGGFGRPRIQPGTIRVQTPGGWRLATVDDVVDALDAPSPIRAELRVDLHRSAYLTDLTSASVRNRGPRHGMSYDALEGAIDEGHPYHPCFKARSGFSDADHLAYGPEAGATFQLHWLAVADALVDKVVPDNFWQSELGESAALTLCNRATASGVDLSRFQLIPLHPWQAQYLSRDDLYLAWLDDGSVVSLGQLGDHYRATQSVRTLANATDPSRAHVKTALAMRNTSSLRTIEPYSVCVAPVISNWLQQVLNSDPLFDDKLSLVLLPEYAGIIAGRSTPLAGHLAVLFRQSPQGSGLSADEVCPFNALALTEADGLPWIDPWVQKFGLHRWLDQLLQVAVLPVWHLMVAHGIGLEAHAQNLILRHEGGWPVGLIARDFHESIEYVPDLLSRPDLVPDLGAIDPAYQTAAPGEFHLMPGAEALRELVMDTLFIYNLADLAALLSRHYCLPENLFWRRVRWFLDDHAARHGLQQRQACFEPFAAEVFTESLMTMKMNGGTGVFRHAVPNPLNPLKG